MADLDSVAIEILKKIAEENRGCTAEWLADAFKIEVQKMQYYLDTLVDRKFLSPFIALTQPITYRITKKGRKYLFEKDLL